MADSSKHSDNLEAPSNQVDALLKASVPYELKPNGIYLVEVKQYALSKRFAYEATDYYRRTHNIDIQFVFTAGDDFALRAIPAIEADDPVTDLATDNPNTTTELIKSAPVGGDKDRGIV